jgi:hypothetical protein
MPCTPDSQCEQNKSIPKGKKKKKLSSGELFLCQRANSRIVSATAEIGTKLPVIRNVVRNKSKERMLVARGPRIARQSDFGLEFLTLWVLSFIPDESAPRRLGSVLKGETKFFDKFAVAEQGSLLVHGCKENLTLKTIFSYTTRVKSFVGAANGQCLKSTLSLRLLRLENRTYGARQSISVGRSGEVDVCVQNGSPLRGSKRYNWNS